MVYLRTMKKALRIIVSVCVFMVLVSMPTRAPWSHPHAWIDLRSTLVFDDAGQAVALELEWLFGDFYSAYILDDITMKGEDIIEGLRETARGNLVELAAYDYFVDFLADDEPVPFDRVEQFETGVLEGRVYLNFSVPFASAVDPVARDIRYAVYDPTYYIEILYAEEGRKASVSGRSCETVVVAANPTFEQAAFAASLDQTESGGSDLGAVFAEWVELSCP